MAELTALPAGQPLPERVAATSCTRHRDEIAADAVTLVRRTSPAGIGLLRTPARTAMRPPIRPPPPPSAKASRAERRGSRRALEPYADAARRPHAIAAQASVRAVASPPASSLPTTDPSSRPAELADIVLHGIAKGDS